MQSLLAHDWPRWRGPNSDGISTEINWNPKSIQPSNIIWKAELGKGYSSFSVKDGLLYTMGTIGGEDDSQDVIYCLNANTGKEIWRHTYANKLGGWPGPRITPTINNGRIYTISRTGKTFCLNAKTGSVIWKRDLAAEQKAVDPDCGISGSPIIYENAIIYNVGGKGLALNKNTGAVIWHSGADKGGFASPVLYQKAGKTHLALLSRTVLNDINPANGNLNWSTPWLTKYEENTIDPIIKGDKLFISTGYGKGAALMDIKNAEPKVIWENKNISNHFHNCVLVGDHLYGIHGDYGRKGTTLRCINFNTGEIAWETPMDFGPVSVAGNKLIHLGEKGKVVVAEVNPQAYKELASAQILPEPDDTGVRRSRVNRCWAPAVLVNSKLYLRNSYGSMVCLNLK